MPVTVCSKEVAPKLAENHDFVVSCLDPNMRKKWTHNFGPNHLTTFFEDTEHPSEKEWMQMNREVRTILGWARTKKLTLEDRILVHCHAGVSRSSAVAWLLLVMLGMDQKEAFQNLLVRFPNIWPNKEVMSIGDTFLEKKGELYKFACSVDVELSERHRGYLGYGG